MNWLNALANKTPFPEQAELGLIELRDSWKGEESILFHLFENAGDMGIALAHLLAISPISRKKLRADPHALPWILNPELCRGHRDLSAMYKARQGVDDHMLMDLRCFKARELLRIALREVAGLADIRQSGPELTTVAEVCVREIWKQIQADLIRRWGNPGEESLVLAMGKLGGSELNFSSDIDLIFFYGVGGEVRPGFTRQQYFERMYERFVQDFTKSSPFGELFRLDLRLRPEGDSGAIIQSFASMENYYAGYGETWERMALGKARGICGSRELAYEFEQILQPFIYPRTVSPDLLDEVAIIKARIERKLAGTQEVQCNVKLGKGGIREIEFITQTLQLVHGSRNAFLQQRNTLRALEGLATLNLLPQGAVASLHDAYIFLRKVEHRVQMMNEQQLHVLPDDPTALTLFSKSLGFFDSSEFMATYAQHTHGVRSIFEGILSSGNRATPKVVVPEFRDVETAKKRLGELGAPLSNQHVSPRTRRIYRRLEPILLKNLSEIADPDMSLNSFVDFVEAYGIRGLLYETLSTNPRLLELLIKLFDSSRFLTQIAIRRPQWIEDITRSGILFQAWTVDQHLEALMTYPTQVTPFDALRRHRQFHALRIGLREILGIINDQEFFVEYSALAESTIRQAMILARCHPETTLIALGKFGAQEVGYGADLDVVFLGTDIAGMERLLEAMTARTQEGSLFPVDTRLRPYGVAGSLAVELPEYIHYFKQHAQVWEIQSLTKARVICGNDISHVRKTIDDLWQQGSRSVDLLGKIQEMFQRVNQHRSQGEEDIKTGEGGIVMAEFVVQYLQMQWGIREPNTWIAIENLQKAKQWKAAAASKLKAAYSFLRKVEKVMRRVEDRSISELPTDPSSRSILARRMGFLDIDSFNQVLSEYRSDIATVFSELKPV